MNDLPRQALRRIIRKHGREIVGDARRCESLLNDLCGAHRREINVLVNAVEERVPLDLLTGIGVMPIELLLKRLEKQLEEQTAMTAEAASWAVESWALALDLTTEAEIQTRRNRPASAAPPKIPAIVPPPPAAPPVNHQSLPMPKPSPPIVFPNNQPAQQPPIQTPTTPPPIAARRSFGILRGCLLVGLLLAVASIGLFFGVPYAIEKMRETQRERNSEPPRFPVR